MSDHVRAPSHRLGADLAEEAAVDDGDVLSGEGAPVAAAVHRVKEKR